MRMANLERVGSPRVFATLDSPFVGRPVHLPPSAAEVPAVAGEHAAPLCSIFPWILRRKPRHHKCWQGSALSTVTPFVSRAASKPCLLTAMRSCRFDTAFSPTQNTVVSQRFLFAGRTARLAMFWLADLLARRRLLMAICSWHGRHVSSRRDKISAVVPVAYSVGNVLVHESSESPAL